MKLEAHFEDGHLGVVLLPETDAEKRMIGAVLDQPQTEIGCSYLDKTLVSASLAYDGHWTNKMIRSVKLNIYRPNAAQERKKEK